MRHLHARGCARPFPGLPRLGKRPWKLKASTAAGANTPPGSAVTAGRAMTAPAPAKRGVAVGARPALRAPPQPFVASSSQTSSHSFVSSALAARGGSQNVVALRWYSAKAH